MMSEENKIKLSDFDKSNLTVTFNDDVSIEEVEDFKNTKTLKIDNIDPSFYRQIMKRDVIKHMFSDESVQEGIAKLYVPMEVLLKFYQKEDVCQKLGGWEFIGEYFKDHMDIADVLEYIGWEKVKDHFHDVIQIESGENDINTGEQTQCLLEVVKDGNSKED